MTQFILQNIDGRLSSFLVLILITVLSVVLLSECIYSTLGKKPKDEKTKESGERKTIYERIPKEILTWFPILLSILAFAFFSTFMKLDLNMPNIIIIGFFTGCVSTAFYSGGMKRILRLIRHRR